MNLTLPAEYDFLPNLNVRVQDKGVFSKNVVGAASIPLREPPGAEDSTSFTDEEEHIEGAKKKSKKSQGINPILTPGWRERCRREAEQRIDSNQALIIQKKAQKLGLVSAAVEEIEDDVEASMTMVPFEFSIEPDEVGATLFGVEDPRPLDDEKVVALVVGVDIPKAPVPVVHVEDPVPLAEDAEAIATAGVTVDDPVPLAEDAEAIAPARVNVEAQAPAGVNVEAQAPVGVNVEKKEVNNVDIDALLAKPAEVILPNEVADLRAEVEAKKEEEKEKLNAEKEERKRLREEAKVAREAAKAAKKEEKALAKVTANAYKTAEKDVIKAQRAAAKAAADEFKAAKLELENAKKELHSASNGGSGGGGGRWRRWRRWR